jgi:hypothetical protein
VTTSKTADAGRQPIASKTLRCASFLLILSLGATLLLTWPLAPHARDRLPNTNVLGSDT